MEQGSVLASPVALQIRTDEGVLLSSDKKRAGSALLNSPSKDALLTKHLETMASEIVKVFPEAKRQRRQRVLVDVHNQHDSDDENEGGEIVENAYERERLERIKRNQEVMRQMGLRQLAIETATAARGFLNNPGSTTDRCAPAAKPKRPPAGGKKSHHQGPRRQSSRNRTLEDSSAFLQHATTSEVAAALQEIDTLEGDHLMELEDYFKFAGIDASNAIQVDGHFSGWVPSHIAENYGLPLEHPGDAWFRASAAASGGSSSGSGKRGGRKKGTSDAKAKSSASLSYNPNAYFYRHVAPHEKQAQGEWSQEEQDRFMDVVRQWGVGDNWGLFASHIAQRVGYQCSAFYRDVIIPSGLVIDKRWKMQRNGKALFVR